MQSETSPPPFLQQKHARSHQNYFGGWKRLLKKRTLLRPLESDERGDPATHSPADDDSLLVPLGQQLVQDGDRVLLPPDTRVSPQKYTQFGWNF